MKIVVSQMLEEPNNPLAPTTLINPWALNMIGEMRNHGHEVIHLVGPTDRPEDLNRALQEADPQLYINYGHGLRDAIIGSAPGDGGLELVDDEKVLTTFGPLVNKNNSQWLKGRINFVVSCLTAAELGPDAVRKGAAGYLSYQDTFEFGILDNKTAPGFQETAGVGLLALLDGLTLGAAEEITKNVIEQWISKYYHSGGPVATSFAALLLHNKNALRLVGDPNARLTL